MISFAAIAIATAGALFRFKAIGNGRMAVRIWVRGYVLMAVGMGLLTVEALIVHPVLNIGSQVIIYVGALHLPAALSVFNRGDYARKHVVVAIVAFAAMMSVVKAYDSFRFEIVGYPGPI